MSFVVTGLSPAPFSDLFGADAAALAEAGAIRRRVDAAPGFPCRIRLVDATPGETVLLLNHEHQPADTPYRSRHAIFVTEGADAAARYVDQIPPSLVARLLALRAFDAEGMMLDAEVVDGAQAEPLIERLLADPRTDYLHAHAAKRGCYLARIDRL
ncbi:MAG TPA: DUF1203 domain-containing protein [Caulobacter sp.]|nr:DUF1203 domain-containing protein [Caulobacter sp.]